MLLQMVEQLQFPSAGLVQSDSSDAINEEFQSARELVSLFRCQGAYHDPSPQISRAFKRITDIANDFTYAVQTYGRIIVSELNLPEAQRTIKVDSRFGGVGGGKKYFIAGILFKFATDASGFYGGDHFAAKAAKHELNSLMAFSRSASLSPEIGYPLMALLDLRGYRLIASSLVPIDRGSLIYGSTDGGVTVVNTEPLFSDKFAQIAAHLHLKAHRSSDASLATPIFGPSDMEAHLGSDRRFYVIDLARLFPPEFIPEGPARRKGQQLYSLLRPELVMGWPTPLSSDAFSPFGKIDRAEHNSQVRCVTEHLHGVVIPQFAKALDLFPPHLAQSYPAHFSLVHTLHNHGINVRHLGHVWLFLTCPHWKAVVALEIIARATKNLMHALLRDVIHHTGRRLVQVPFKVVLARFLALALFVPDHNRLTALHAKYQQFCLELFLPALFEQFPVIAGASFPLSFNRRHLYHRLHEMTGVQLSSDALHNRLGHPECSLYDHDIEQEPFRIRYLSLIDMAHGFVDLERASAESIHSANYYTQQAIDHFSKALVGTASDPLLLWGMAMSLVRAASLISHRRRSHTLFFLAAEYLVRSQQLTANSPIPLQDRQSFEPHEIIDLAHCHLAWACTASHAFGQAFSRSIFIRSCSTHLTLGAGALQVFSVHSPDHKAVAKKPRALTNLVSRCPLVRVVTFDATDSHPHFAAVLLVATVSHIQVWGVSRKGSMKSQLCPQLHGPQAAIRSIRLLYISKLDLCFATLSGKSTLHIWKVRFNDPHSPVCFTPSFSKSLPDTAFVSESCMLTRCSEEVSNSHILLALPNAIFLLERKKIQKSFLKIQNDQSFPEPLATFQPPKGYIKSVWFSGKNLVIAGNSDHSILIWRSVQNRYLLDTMLGHAAPVTALDGNLQSGLVVSGDLQGIIRMWHYPSKICIRVLHQFTDPIESLYICGNDQIVVTSLTAHLYVWHRSPEPDPASTIIADNDQDFDQWTASLRSGLI